jgi:hypothetical protein
MSEKPPTYEPPKAEEVDTADGMTISTAAGQSPVGVP